MHKTRVRRVGALLTSAAALVALGTVGAATSVTADSMTPTTTAAGGSTASGGGGIAPIPTGVKCEAGLKVAFLGALSGENGALGTNMINGAQIAFDEFNKANPDCQVTFDKSTQFDSQGDSAQASPLADKIVGDAKIVGLIGPGFSGETDATMPKFEAAGLPMITPGATNAKLSTKGWKMFHRILANDDKQAPGVVNLIKGIIKGTKVGVIDDGTPYGKGLADSVRSGLGDMKAADATIVPKSSDMSAAVTAMKNGGVDVVFFGGYYSDAVTLVKALRDGGSKATFVSGDGSLDPKFSEGAGEAGNGAYLTATGAPADVNPDFQAAFKAKFNTDPLLYSPESYDCARVFLAGIAAGKVTRADLAAFVASYDAPGITKQIKFDATGEPAGEAVFYTVVDGGKLMPKGIIPAA